MTRKKDVALKFLGEVEALVKIKNFQQVAEGLKDFVQSVNKEIRALADEHGVSLKVDMVFDLKPKSRSVKNGSD